MIKVKMPKFVLLTSLLLSMYACSSKPPVQKIPMTSDVNQELNTLGDQINFARQSQVNALSPDNFKEAVSSYDDAKQAYSKGKNKEKILSEVALSRAYLKEANNVAHVANQNIEQVINARKSAIELGAPDHFRKEWEKADRDLMNLTSQIENKNLRNIDSRREELLRSYMDLELRAIKHNSLIEANSLLGQARGASAQKFVPLAYQKAEKSIKDTEDYITANRYNTPEIIKRANESKKLAQEAIQLNQIAQSSQGLSPEERALKYNEKLMAAQRLNRVEDQLSLTQSALEREKTTNNYLAEKQFLEDRYLAIQREFSSDEAEVYKQDDAILIRLKGMQFKPGSAQVSDAGTDLLYKVQRALGELGKSHIVVEGHTDATGNEKNNVRLSKERAEAVKRFLLRNGTNVTNIESIGYGSEYPNMTNKTAEGRAMNRRVDLIVRPQI